MAYPVVVERVTGKDDVSQTSHSITLPAAVDPGDLLFVCVVAAKNQPTFSGWDQGFTEIEDTPVTDSDVSMGAAFKVAAGTEDGATLSVNTSAATPIVWVIYRMTGVGGEIWASGTASFAGWQAPSTSADPPALTPTSGPQAFLWVTVAGTTWGADFTADPTGYTNGVGITNPGFNDAAIRSVERTLNAASEDPSAFTIDNSEVWVAQTFAFYPAATKASLTGYFFLPSGDASRVTTPDHADFAPPNAAFRTDFTGTNGDPWPSPWTDVSASGGSIEIQGNEGRLNSGTGASRAASGVIGTSLEIVFSATRQQTSTGFLAGFQYGTDWQGGNPENPINAYFIEVDVSGVRYFGKFVSGSFTNLGGTWGADPGTSKYWYRMRYESATGDLKVRQWADGGGEPGTWDVEVTDTDLAGNNFRVFASNWSGQGALDVDDWTITPLPATTSTFDIRGEILAYDAGAQRTVWGQWIGGTLASYLLCVGSVSWNSVRFYWSNDGTTVNSADSTTTIPGLAPGDRVQLRCLFQARDGASGRTVDFYYKINSTADLTDDTGWTQLGTQVTGAATSMFDSTAEVAVGRYSSGSSDQQLVQAYQVALKKAGTTSMWADFRSGTWEPTGTDAQGHTWTPQVNADHLAAPPTLEESLTGFNAGGTPTYTINKPAGAVEGELLVVHIVGSSSSGPITAYPAGWTEHANQVNGDYNFWVGSKIVGASEPASWDWTFGNNNFAAHQIDRVSGAAAPEAVNVQAVGATNNASPSLTTLGTERLLLVYAGEDLSSAETWSIDSGIERVDETLGGEFLHIGGYVDDAPTAGVYTRTVTTTAVSQDLHGVMLSIPPPSVGGPVIVWANQVHVGEG